MEVGPFCPLHVQEGKNFKKLKAFTVIRNQFYATSLFFHSLVFSVTHFTKKFKGDNQHLTNAHLQI